MSQLFSPFSCFDCLTGLESQLGLSFVKCMFGPATRFEIAGEAAGGNRMELVKFLLTHVLSNVATFFFCLAAICNWLQLLPSTGLYTLSC